MKITLLKSFLLLGAFVCFGIAKAQTVSGTVSDANGPLPGASVVVKGTTNGTQTDFDGNYTINDVAADAVIVFSYIGFSSQEIAVNGQTTINVVLQEDANELDEVVVVGYGTQTKRTSVGAVESVKAEEFNKGVIVNPQQLIQGKTAGVQISATTGEPGAAVNVRIRGTASVRANNNPLYVVDGIPLSGASTSAGTGGGTNPFGDAAALDPLSFLNPNDIASIDILKDASATAIYGSRGANGVVLITTKGGRSQKGILEFSSTYSIGYIPNQLDLLSVDQFLQAQSDLGATGQDFGARNDYQDEIYRTSFTQNYNLSYGSSGENGSYRMSFGYQDQEGEVEDSTFDRLTARINATQRFFDDKLTLSTQATISNIEAQRPPITDSPNARGDLLSTVWAFNPTRPILNTDGSFNQPTFETRNPVAVLELSRNASSTLRALINLSAEYRFSDNISFKTSIGLDKSSSSAYSAISPLFNSASTLGVGRAVLNEIDLTNSTWESYFSFNKEFGDDILSATIGHSYQEFVAETIFVEAAAFRTNDLFQMVNNIAAAQTFALNSSLTRDELQSFFARGNYSMDGKFNFSGTVRIDGSSRFGGNNKYGTFGAIGAAWTMSEEDWFPEFFDRFKLRAAYGVVGNQEGVGSNQFTQRERFGENPPGGSGRPNAGGINNGGVFTPASAGIVTFDNPDLKWEETEQINIGIDFAFLDSRITGSVEYYNKTTTDFLLQIQSAQPAVQPFFFQNIDGDIKNNGAELNLNVIPVETEDFTWDFNFNMGYNDNVIENYDGPPIDTGQINGPGLTGAFAQRIANGQPLFSFFTREFQGLDENGGNIFANDGAQVFVGESALPDITMGITQNFRYKNWDLSIFFNGQFGQSIYSNNRNAFFTIGNLSQGRNVTADVLPFIGVENPFNPAEVSTRFLEDGSFLRLQNVTIGHNFPLSENSIFSSLRVFANAQNLFVITDYSGQDPEVSVNRQLNNVPSLGIDLTAFPRPTTISLGFNASF
ncbi:SusC/RagA family TonB-linked outer membrane protein [Flagellimonas aquimarina]|uniref:SusC/RagA family TonB-linked outer membrane protein n=1 Tax=Flagellimonas aquimarina TaxID=2201895 RepID=A0A316LJH3_9FLAO|nr:TonB-dependent receptor [Allomuricauda koreensis]PWL40270.1 SusC/RagA family TonB-linked outer membrane protein [Allomuricauda koreensis]